MALQLGDTAPDFEAETDGRPDQLPRLDRRLLGGAVLAPEGLHAGVHDRARLHGEDQAGVRPPQRQDHRPLRRSVDNTDWAKDIEETQGHAPNYPIIGDADFNVSKLYGMLPARRRGRSDRRARRPTTRRCATSSSIGPDKKVKLILVYPMTTGRNFDEVLRVIDSLQLTAKHKVATPVNWQQGEDVIIAGSVSNDEAKETYPDGWKEPRPYIRIVPAAAVEANSAAADRGDHVDPRARVERGVEPGALAVDVDVDVRPQHAARARTAGRAGRASARRGARSPRPRSPRRPRAAAAGRGRAAAASSGGGGRPSATRRPRPRPTRSPAGSSRSRSSSRPRRRSRTPGPVLVPK